MLALSIKRVARLAGKGVMCTNRGIVVNIPYIHCTYTVTWSLKEPRSDVRQPNYCVISGTALDSILNFRLFREA